MQSFSGLKRVVHIVTTGFSTETVSQLQGERASEQGNFRYICSPLSGMNEKMVLIRVNIPAAA
jgi:hypothetical protein